MLKILILLLLAVPFNLLGQTIFVSAKYRYSFVIPDGWYSKDKIYNPDVDAKIVDGKGNSLTVSVKNFPTSTKLTVRQQMENTSNQAMEEQFNAVYGETKIVKRGVVSVGLKDFYYIHLMTPYTDGYKLYHKLFFYSEGYKILTIDACAIETYLDETSPAYGIMIATFEFENLKAR